MSWMEVSEGPSWAETLAAGAAKRAATSDQPQPPPGLNAWEKLVMSPNAPDTMKINLDAIRALLRYVRSAMIPAGK
jgi:hypothetical protein